jgi:translocation and assembly module TamA
MKRLLLLLGALLAGCATPAPPVLEVAPAEARADYRFTVQAPAPLRELLQTHLDLARFQASGAALGRLELARLSAATPAQAQALAETEGYFASQAVIERSGDEIKLIVTPGPRTRIARLTLDFEDALAASDADAVALRAQLAAGWPLPEGAGFSQGAWAGGKSELLARARASGYPLARWADTEARIDVPPDSSAHTAELRLLLASGPRARLGPLLIEGLVAHSEATVRRLAGFEPGTPYTEQLLAEFQERLVKTQLFDTARVQLLPEVLGADGLSSVRVTVREAPLQQATVALGYHANTGQRVSVEHLHRLPFGLPLRARSKLDLGRDLRAAELELSSHPQPHLSRNLAAVQVEEDRSGDQIATSLSLRLGRLREAAQDERLSYLELLRSRETVAGASAVTNGAVSLNQQWIRRRLDSALLPTDGHQALALVGLGVADGSDSGRGAFGQARGRAAFGRVQFKLGAYRPFGDHWFGSARAELAQVIAPARLGVPDKLLFRAGGDDSVRGYAFHSLGPLQNGAVVGGRVLGTASVELARPITLSLPSLWGAVFVDAGNAADRWGDYRPVVGWGAGLRWRSPVGPLRIDAARAEETKRWRLHFSVGIAL